jgi:glycosyltransferase involved in cell wall biosynthesis
MRQPVGAVVALEDAETRDVRAPTGRATTRNERRALARGCLVNAPRRRILQVVARMERGGVQTSLLQMLKHIDRTRYDNTFLVQNDDPGVYDEVIRALGSQVISCPGHRNPLLFARNLAKMLYREGPFDIVHCHARNHIGLIMLIAAWKKVPMRIAHSRNDQRARPERHPHRRLYDKLMRTWIRRHATTTVAVSRAAGDDLFGPGWDTGQGGKVIHSGFDFTLFGKMHDTAGIRDSLGLPRDCVLLGHVGRFVEAKNHRFLIDVIAEVVRMDGAARGLLVGGGPLLPVIEQKARSLGIIDHITFAGERDDVPALMAAMDVFVFPSIHEGLPRALIEAQAAGLPCIVSEQVTAEADVVPSLIRRLPLAAPSLEWARAARFAAQHPQISRKEALRLVMRSDFDIETSSGHERRESW